MEDTMARNEYDGPRLRARREALGLTVAQMASRAGCHPSTIRRYERRGVGGRVLCSRAFRLCAAYRIGADELAQA